MTAEMHAEIHSSNSIWMLCREASIESCAGRASMNSVYEAITCTPRPCCPTAMLFCCMLRRSVIFAKVTPLPLHNARASTSRHLGQSSKDQGDALDPPIKSFHDAADPTATSVHASGLTACYPDVPIRRHGNVARVLQSSLAHDVAIPTLVRWATLDAVAVRFRYDVVAIGGHGNAPRALQLPAASASAVLASDGLAVPSAFGRAKLHAVVDIVRDDVVSVCGQGDTPWPIQLPGTIAADTRRASSHSPACTAAAFYTPLHTLRMHLRH